ncbi:MAG: Protease HtpX [Chlamydiia bacterium]|nr:Protease HtpX [Chlamydiia bacterium]
MRIMAKRILLFLAVNFLVLLVVSLVLNLLNIRPYLRSQGLDYGSLLVFCGVWGMGGAFISLALSRIMAKWMLGVHVIDPQVACGTDQQLVTLVHMLAKRAGLPAMPEVGIYDSPEVNAFATGPTRSRALVAVSSGLLRRMNTPEIEGVLAHEIAHVANGDMVTMTLLQGIVNAFVMFFARVIAYAITRLGKKDDDKGMGSLFLYNMIVMGLEIVFMILGSIVIATYSRFREFRADSGGARLAGRDKMIGALRALERTVAIHDSRAEQPSIQAFKISSQQGLLRFFSTHPPLEDRIARLEQEG